MGLFVKKTVEHNATYDIGAAQTLLVVGLGNVGKEYTHTRHNVGFECLDALQGAQSEFAPWQDKKALKCALTSGTFGKTKVILIKPTTFMNNSGEAVRAVLDYYKLTLKNLVVVHDELDVNFGQIRTRIGGSSAGNNGIKSVTQHVSENYGRIRIGIGPKTPEQMDSADFVLGKFNKDEQKNLPLLKREVQSILIEFIYRGELYPDSRSFII
jgi:PTH1 family peptidyl-tRNA hydrolase